MWIYTLRRDISSVSTAQSSSLIAHDTSTHELGTGSPGSKQHVSIADLTRLTLLVLFELGAVFALLFSRTAPAAVRMRLETMDVTREKMEVRGALSAVCCNIESVRIESSADDWV
jgi:hypothetical protein